VKKYIIIDSMKVLLDQIMYERNLTVRQVSIMTGVPKSTISDIVSGRISPRLNTLEQLATGLKVHITDLFESTYK
jgi:transcriptional regulator with XRE-family HTH domain